MAMSWSHLHEAYAYAQEQVQNKPHDWLEVVYAEWQAAEFDENGCLVDHAFDQEAYDEALLKAAELPNDILADYIWDRMSEYGTCDNGGFNAWSCPTGCGCHIVPFSEKSED